MRQRVMRAALPMSTYTMSARDGDLVCLVYSLPGGRLYAMPTRATTDKGRVMTNYVVSIGRDVKGTSLDDVDWLKFRDDVRHAIKENGGKLRSEEHTSELQSH